MTDELKYIKLLEVISHNVSHVEDNVKEPVFNFSTTIHPL